MGFYFTWQTLILNLKFDINYFFPPCFIHFQIFYCVKSKYHIFLKIAHFQLNPYPKKNSPSPQIILLSKTNLMLKNYAFHIK